MRDTVHAGVVAVAALSLRISFALPAIFAVSVVVDWYIENLGADGEPAFFFLFMMKATLARKILAVLVRKNLARKRRLHHEQEEESRLPIGTQVLDVPIDDHANGENRRKRKGDTQ